VLRRLSVVGAGSWGTAIAAIAARSAEVEDVRIWARRRELAHALNLRHENPEYLPGTRLPDALVATASMEEAVAGADLVVMAVPSHGFRAVLEEVAAVATPGRPVLSLTKGLEQATLKRMTEVVAEVMPSSPVAVLTGPNLAREVVAGEPAATVVASKDADLALEVQEALTTRSFRVYTNFDVIGSEMAGATKNVIAIAAGICEGLGFGESTRAALVTRGLAELGRLVVAMGGDRITFAGLAGVGDLVATCTSPLSRNRSIGVRLGQGRSLAEAERGMTMVAEGVKTARPLLALAEAHDVEMPIATQVAAVLEGRQSPLDAVSELMGRAVKPEMDGLDARS
jgi:glycerol-3-phosphate dehydrogenase (NAD(P)+)